MGKSNTRRLFLAQSLSASLDGDENDGAYVIIELVDGWWWLML